MSLTVKMIGALGVSWLANFLWMPWLIGKLHKWHFGQEIRREGPKSHWKKQGTPIMGGLGFIASTLLASLLFAGEGFSDPSLLLIVVSFLGYGAIGFWDDFLVIRRHSNDGLSPRQKFGLQTVLALILVVWYMSFEDTKIHLPFSSGMITLPGVLFFLVGMVMCTGETNAVNLTDGLDGLSSSVMIEALIPLVLFAVKQGRESVAVLLMAMIGGLIAYLHYNKYPAQVMMGDTGSLAMGGIFAASALVLKEELAILIIGGIFLAEVLSVVIQVTYFRATHGRRFFRMAPLHHHFELGGMKETDVVRNFRIAGAVLSALGILMGVMQ